MVQMIPLCVFLQKTLLCQHSTEDSIACPFYKGLRCVSLIQKIPLGVPSAGNPVVFPLYRGRHCASFVQMIPLCVGFHYACLFQMIPFCFSLQRIPLSAICKGFHYVSVVQRILLCAPSTLDLIVYCFCKLFYCACVLGGDETSSFLLNAFCY